MDILTTVVVAAVVGPQNKLLWTLRADGQGWVMPGGKVDPPETPDRGVIRELKEEMGAGWEPTKILFLGTYQCAGLLPWLVYRVHTAGGLMSSRTAEVVSAHWSSNWSPPTPPTGELSKAHADLAAALLTVRSTLGVPLNA